MNETIMNRYRRVVACIARHFSRFSAEGEMVVFFGGLCLESIFPAERQRHGQRESGRCEWATVGVRSRS
jgi:hypothetical protein